jgi:predicted ester cyclase
MSQQNKAVVRRLVEEVLNAGRMEVIDELYAPALVDEAKAWIAPFRASFPDVQMEIIDLIAEGDTVVGRFTCSGTHLGDWLGYGPTGRRFEAVDEVYFFGFEGDGIVSVWAIEDTLDRFRQLGLEPRDAS